MEFSSEFLRQFEPIGTLGEGGMARVILANQTSLQRQVAIKFMAGAAFPAAEASERFMREAKMLAKLDHPNILKIYDLGIEDDQPYLVLEYVRGESVRERLNRDNQLKPEDAGRIALMVARGLAYAHDKSILHRDVKPENVLLSIEGGVKLLDFGLGKLLELSENISHGGVILGTPAYLAPELIMGNPPSAASDLYTVGVLLYEMLAGQTPFGDSAEPDKLLERTKMEAPTEPLEKVKDRRLVEILIKSLRRDTEERYQQACELVEALELYLGVSADPRIRRSSPGMMRPMSRSGRHGRTRAPISRTARLMKEMPGRPMVAAAAFVIALVVALYVFTLRPPRALGDPGAIELLSGIKGARVRWRSTEPYAGAVTATSPGSPDVALLEAQPTTNHDVLLMGLTPKRSYELKVGDEASARFPPVRLNTADHLEIPPAPSLEAQSWDRAAVVLELNVPATVVARADNPELTVSGGDEPRTSHKLIVSGPGAGVGLFSLEVDFTTVEGTSEHRALPLRGAYDSLSEYVRTAAFTNDLEVVASAWLGAANSEDALIAARSAILSSAQLKTRTREIDWLARCLTESGVAPERAVRVYELLSELERFNRIIPAAIAHHREGKVPFTDIPPLLPIASALEAFAPSSCEQVPADAKPVNPLYLPVGRLRPALRPLGQDVGSAAVFLGDLPADPRTAPTELAFDRFLSDLPTEGRVRVTLKGRALSSAVFVDLEINKTHRLRFFGSATALAVNEPMTALAKMASDMDVEKLLPGRALSVTVPASMFKREKNAFLLTAGIIAPPMAGMNGPAVPVIHWVGWQPVH